MHIHYNDYNVLNYMFRYLYSFSYTHTSMIYCQLGDYCMLPICPLFFPELLQKKITNAEVDIQPPFAPDVFSYAP